MTHITRQSSRLRADKRHLWAVVLACPGVFFAAPANTVDTVVAAAGDGMSALAHWLAGVGLLILVVLPIASLIWWSRKQDEINNIMALCRRSLMFARHEADRVVAARALGGARDPEALLVLLDVATDEEAEQSVRLAAREALGEVAKRYRKRQSVIQTLLSAADDSEFQTLIGILIVNFERGEEGYVQSAYVIAREYFRLGEYEDARSWFRKANARDRKAAVYRGKIEPRIAACNERIVAEGDQQFSEGNYNEAKRLFTDASAGLDDRDKQKLSPHLRMVASIASWATTRAPTKRHCRHCAWNRKRNCRSG